jgi:predicted deacylase
MGNLFYAVSSPIAVDVFAVATRRFGCNEKMKLEETFDRSRLNLKEKMYLDVTNLPEGGVVRLPLLVVHGGKLGKIILVLGAVHGDEHEGPQAIREVFDSLEPTQLIGKFVGVPVANPPAHSISKRTSPIDNLNLARTFPGRINGTVTERIAHQISRMIMMSDFLIDLHSSGTGLDSPTLCGYAAGNGEAGRVAREAAEIFGTPVVWEHPPVVPAGRTLSVAAEKGIPALYTEASGGGWLTKETVLCYKNGVLNVMKYLGMLAGPKSGAHKVKHHIFGGGDLDKDSVAAPASGFLVSNVEVLDHVGEGDIIGRIIGPLGEAIQELKSPSDGYIVFKKANPIVYCGESIYLLAHAQGKP